MAELREQQHLLGDILRLAEEARRNPPAMGRREIGGELDLRRPDEVSSVLREGLSVLLDDPRVSAALAKDPWESIDWPKLLRQAEILAIEGLLGEDADS